MFLLELVVQAYQSEYQPRLRQIELLQKASLFEMPNANSLYTGLHSLAQLSLLIAESTYPAQSIYLCWMASHPFDHHYQRLGGNYRPNHMCQCLRPSMF